MSLTPDTRIGVYEVTAKIGEGGMGEVYRARDTTLDRDVALKVLPEAFTSDPDRLARFEREARVLASLNHPNIGGIHGLEQTPSTSSGQAGVRALVLELVEGPTLAEVINDRSGRSSDRPVGLSLDETTRIATQIAQALEAAHAQGVIHRDLKPANVKVRPDGTVKVLDFGLAKAFATDAADASASLSPTISLTAAATQMGMVVGTAAYMAPEQASGQGVDKRADVWALGVVIYEMLTGRRPFAGDNVSKTLAHVIAMEPDWGALPDGLPPVLVAFLKRSLAKDPGDRVHDVADLRLAMAGAFGTGETTPATQVAAPVQAHPWQRPLPMAAAALLLAALAGAGAWLVKPDPERVDDVLRFTIDTPAVASLAELETQVRDIAIARDGSFIVYTGPAPDGGGQTQLYVRRIGDLEGAPLRGTAGGVGPFISPDGDWVGFTDTARLTLLRVASAGGGPPDTIGRSEYQIRGPVWGDDDRIVFGSADAGLFSIAGGGGEPASLTTLDTELEDDHSWPALVPGANAVVYVSATAQPLSTGELTLVDLDTGASRPLGVAGTSPHVTATGHLLYAAADRALRAVPFDIAALEVRGTPAVMTEGIAIHPSGAAHYAVSAEGRLVYLGGAGDLTGVDPGDVGWPLTWVSRDGQLETLPLPNARYDSVTLSPDGTRVAAQRDGPTGRDIWVYDLNGAGSTRLGFDESDEFGPSWSDDGQSIVFAERTGDDARLVRRAADGTGELETLASEDIRTDVTWTSDGRLLTSRIDSGNIDIVVVSPAAGGSVEPLLAAPTYHESNPSLSPDGRWLAYGSDESGRREVYLRPFPDLDSRRRTISTSGGMEPIWSRDGRELFYVARGQDATLGIEEGPVTLMRVPFDDANPFDAEIPEPLFPVTGFLFNRGPRSYQVDVDGSRFLFIGERSGDGATASEPLALALVVVDGWFTELEERVPVP